MTAPPAVTGLPLAHTPADRRNDAGKGSLAAGSGHDQPSGPRLPNTTSMTLFSFRGGADLELLGVL